MQIEMNLGFATVLLYLYRPKAIAGMVVKFDVYMDNDILISHLKNGEKVAYKIETFGNHTFVAINQKGQKKEFSLDIKKGQEYYVRCGTDVSKPYGVAQFSMLDNVTGHEEFNKMK